MALAAPGAPVALVLRALGLGDLLTAVPALRGLRARLPDHEIVLATDPGLSPLVELTGAVDRVLPARGLAPLAWSGAPPDVAVNLHGSGADSHLLLRALRPASLLAYASPAAGHDGPAWRDEEHEVSRWCRLVTTTLRGPCDPDALDLALPGVLPAVPAAAVVHPGAAHGCRRWQPERFAAVARALAADGPVVVTGSAAERPLAQAVAAAAGLDPGAVLAGRTSLPELAALVASARLVVSGDTGIAHLASAYRTPSVVLFGPVPPARWGPPGRAQHLAIWHGTGPGDPWAERRDPALGRVDVPEVLDACARVLAAALPCGGLSPSPARAAVRR